MSESLKLLQQLLLTMYSNGSNDVKQEANKFLEKFQKSQEAWNVIFEVLETSAMDQETLMLKMFLAQTLRSKVNYDLFQLPKDSLMGLKDSILNLVVQYEKQSQKLILLQLCISLANFSLQFLEWNDAVDEIIQKLSTNQCIISVLEFLKVLPEELSDVKNTPLTDEEFHSRVKSLIDSNSERVMLLLTQFLDNSASNSAQINSLILDALNSWIREIPIEQMLSINSIASLIFQSVTHDETFDTSVECLITILRETRDFDNLEIIKAIYQQLMNLKPFLDANKDDNEKMDGLTRLFVEAGESWHVLIAKLPKDFKPFVEIILELTSYEEDLDIVKYTFYFWYELKQMLLLEKFKDARAEFYDIYLRLVSVMIKHLRYPITNDLNITDTTQLFGGDREQQDKFKDFRYDMGDVLKDCCAVVGATNALNIPYLMIQEFVSSSQQQPWQLVEAPLFSLRSMAKEVSVKESKIMPQIMNLLIQLPENSKIRYASTLVLGRYTEWTSKHPEFLELQLNYITSGFSNPDKDVMIAAAHALLYFCQDCSSLLINYLEQLFQFYNNVSSSLDIQSLYDVTEGISHILQEIDDEAKVYQITGMFWEPTVTKLNLYLQSDPNSDDIQTKIADEIEIITIYVKILKPRDMNAKENPVSNLIIQQVWPIVLQLINKFGHSNKCSERLTKFVKESVITFGFFMEPILSQIAEMLVKGFKNFHSGCYLWVSGILIRELSDGNDVVKQNIWEFSLQQSINFIQFLKNLEHNNMTLEFPDLIEDFFRMLSDMLMFFPSNFINNENLLSQIYEVSILSLSTLDNDEPLTATLHLLIDLMSWGFESPPVSLVDLDDNTLNSLRLKVLQFNTIIGENLIKVLIHGLVLKFPSGCSLDASDLITKLIRLQNDDKVSITWLNNAIVSLENVSEKERLKLLGSVEVAIRNKDFRRVRSSIRDFVNWYVRKNIRSTGILN